VPADSISNPPRNDCDVSGNPEGVQIMQPRAIALGINGIRTFLALKGHANLSPTASGLLTSLAAMPADKITNLPIIGDRSGNPEGVQIMQPRAIALGITDVRVFLALKGHANLALTVSGLLTSLAAMPADWISNLPIIGDRSGNPEGVQIMQPRAIALGITGIRTFLALKGHVNRFHA
jgi:hypothetical protein